MIDPSSVSLLGPFLCSVSMVTFLFFLKGTILGNPEVVTHSIVFDSESLPMLI